MMSVEDIEIESIATAEEHLCREIGQTIRERIKILKECAEKNEQVHGQPRAARFQRLLAQALAKRVGL